MKERKRERERERERIRAREEGPRAQPSPQRDRHADLDFRRRSNFGGRGGRGAEMKERVSGWVCLHIRLPPSPFALSCVVTPFRLCGVARNNSAPPSRLFRGEKQAIHKTAQSLHRVAPSQPHHAERARGVPEFLEGGERHEVQMVPVHQKVRSAKTNWVGQMPGQRARA